MSAINTCVMQAEHCHNPGGDTKRLDLCYIPYLMRLFSKYLVSLYPDGAQSWLLNLSLVL